MSYIVWDGAICHTFKTAEEAWGYLTPILKDNPLEAENFTGFGKTVANTNNHIAVLRNYDTYKPWSSAPPYMQPKETV